MGWGKVKEKDRDRSEGGYRGSNASEPLRLAGTNAVVLSSSRVSGTKQSWVPQTIAESYRDLQCPQCHGMTYVRVIRYALGGAFEVDCVDGVEPYEGFEQAKV